MDESLWYCGANGFAIEHDRWIDEVVAKLQLGQIV